MIFIDNRPSRNGGLHAFIAVAAALFMGLVGACQETKVEGPVTEIGVATERLIEFAGKASKAKNFTGTLATGQLPMVGINANRATYFVIDRNVEAQEVGVVLALPPNGSGVSWMPIRHLADTTIALAEHDDQEAERILFEVMKAAWLGGLSEP